MSCLNGDSNPVDSIPVHCSTSGAISPTGSGSIMWVDQNGLIIDPYNDPLSVDLIAQLEEHCAGIAEVRVQITVQALTGHTCHCFRSAKTCGDHSPSFFTCSLFKTHLKESIVALANWLQTIESKDMANFFNSSFISSCCYIYTGLAVWKKLQLSANNNDSGPTLLKRRQSTAKVYFSYSLDRGIMPYIWFISVILVS